MLARILIVLSYVAWAVGALGMLAAFNYFLALWSNRSAKATYVALALLPIPWFLIDDMLTDVGIQKRTKMWKALGVTAVGLVLFVALVELRTLAGTN